MKKIYLFFLSIFFLQAYCFSQNIGINADGSSPNVNAMLDIKSNTKGLLIPRTSTTSRITIPNTKGLLVYDSTTSSFWYNDGVAWQEIGNSAALNGTINFIPKYLGSFYIGNSQIVDNGDYVGIGTTNPVARFQVADSSVLFFAGGDIPVIKHDVPQTNFGRKFLWYADKAALRAGYSAYGEWDSSRIGKYSVGLGNGTIASGKYSVALGFATNAAGLASIATGYNSTASGDYSSATGYVCNAKGNYSLAAGYFTNANGDYSTSMGYQSTAGGTYSFAAGNNTAATGPYSCAFSNGSASGSSAFACGNSTAGGEGSFAGGIFSVANGEASATFGRANTAAGDYSFSSGYGCQANKSYSMAMGFSTTANGFGAIALGSHTTAGGDNSFVYGTNSNTTGLSSYIFGTNLFDGGHKGDAMFGDTDPWNAGSVGSGMDNQMICRFSNGYYFLTGGNTARSGMVANHGDNSWSTISDSTKKEKLIPVNGEELLKKISNFKLTTWNYKGQDSKIFRHYGPMAQDFHAAFGHDALGTIGNDTLINQADFLGVSFTAIQALEKRTEKIEEQQQQIENLKKENESLAENNQKMQDQIKTLLSSYAVLNKKIETLASVGNKNNSIAKK